MTFEEQLVYLRERFLDIDFEEGVHGDKPAIYKKGTYVRFEAITGKGSKSTKASIIVVIGVGAQTTLTTKHNFGDCLQRMLRRNAALRKTHSHQRQEINQFVENLRESDVFEHVEVDMSVENFGDHASNIPRVDVRFPNVETVIASIRFLRYAPIDLSGEIEVLFGDEVYEFVSVPQVLDFFGGWEVFRHTDRRVDPSKLQLRAHGAGTMALVPYKELALYAPYLLVMQAGIFSVEQAKVTVTAQTESVYEDANVTDINGALAAIFTQEQTMAYVSAVVEPSLQWDYSFK